MSDEYKLQKAVGDAARAEGYLRDEWLAEVEARRLNDLFEGWKHTRPDDIEGRERIFRQYHEVLKFRENLQRIASEGHMAQAELDTVVKMQKAANER